MNLKKIRKKIYSIVFEADTKAGKNFDIILLIAIVLSTLSVILESVPALSLKYQLFFYYFEIVFTILFFIEYILRIFSIEKKSKYIFSFLGIIDFISMMPAVFTLFFPGVKYLKVVRVVRLLRVFRILKLSRYISEANSLVMILKATRYKIIVFLITVFTIVLIMGTLLYIVEGEESGFTSIPRSVYWAIVTLTTVGYGDIAPVTIIGQTISSIIMLLGYAIIAVPTGIITAEISEINSNSKLSKKIVCNFCENKTNDSDAKYCKKCGKEL